MNRELIIDIAKMFSGNVGIDWDTTSERNLLLLIRDSIEDIQNRGNDK